MERGYIYIFTKSIIIYIIKILIVLHICRDIFVHSHFFYLRAKSHYIPDNNTDRSIAIIPVVISNLGGAFEHLLLQVPQVKPVVRCCI